MNAHCPHRESLIEQYFSAMTAFGEVATDRSPDSRAKRQLTRRTSEAWHKALNAVIEHEREHGCGKADRREGPPDPARAETFGSSHPAAGRKAVTQSI
jgi:hypothetical protein